MSGINLNPVFGRTPLTAAIRASVANTNRDGTGTLADLWAELSTGDGARIDRVNITAVTATTTAGMIRFYDYDGSNNRLLHEEPVTVVAGSGSVPTFSAEVVRSDGLPAFEVLPGHTLRVSTNNAESFDVVGHGWRY